jgi:hypothetical protein
VFGGRSRQAGASQQLPKFQLGLADSTPGPMKDLTNSVARLQLRMEAQQGKPSSSATPCTPAHQLARGCITPAPPLSAMMADDAAALTPLLLQPPAHTPAQQLLELAAHPDSPAGSEDAGEQGWSCAGLICLAPNLDGDLYSCPQVSRKLRT